MSRIPRPLLAAALVYVVFRAWVAMTAFDGIAIPNYEVSMMGNEAWLIADGFPGTMRGIPWPDYYDNAGGQLLTGVLAAPFYALLGSTYLSLKLVPFLLGIGLLLLVWRFLDRNVGRTAAIVGVFAFALAPPTLSKYSLLAKGNHFEGLFFLFLPVVLAFESLGRERRGRWLFAAGLAGGFSIVVYYGSLLTIALLGPALARLRGVRGLARDLRWILPGFLVGAAPLAWLHAATEGRAGGFARRFTKTDPRLDAGGMWDEARSLVVDTLPSGACYEDLGPIPAAVGEWLLIAVMAVAWVVLVRTIARTIGRDDAESSRLAAASTLIASYLPLVLGVIAVGVLKIRPKPPSVEILGVRYLVSYYFYGLLAAAVAIDVLARRGTSPATTAARVMAGALAATGLFVLPIATFAFERSADAVRYPGAFLRNYGGLMQRGAVPVSGDPVAGDPDSGRMTLDPAVIMATADEFEGKERRDILFSAGFSQTYIHLFPDVDQETGAVSPRALRLDAIDAGIPDEARPWIVRGLGAHLRARVPVGAKVPPLVQGWLDVAFADAERREWIAEGFGMSIEYPLRRRYDADAAQTERALEVVPADLAEAVRRGQGIDLGVRLTIGVEGAEERVRATLAGIEDPAQREALRGAIEAEAGRAISAR